MYLKLFRTTFSDKSTVGELYVDGKEYCFTLEDVDRRLESGGVKIFGETCIPRGIYEVVMDYSPKYKRKMPHILNVPQFEGVRIHSGNFAKDSDGCVLVGSTKGKDYVGNSAVTFAKLYELLIQTQEKIVLEII